MMERKHFEGLNWINQSLETQAKSDNRINSKKYNFHWRSKIANKTKRGARSRRYKTMKARLVCLDDTYWKTVWPQIFLIVGWYINSRCKIIVFALHRAHFIGGMINKERLNILTSSERGQRTLLMDVKNKKKDNVFFFCIYVL